MKNVIFKEYEECDLPKLFEIYSYYIENSTATFAIEPITPDQMKKILEPLSQRYKTFVILCNDEICGYALFTRFKAREAYDISAEVTIYLKQGFTGRNIGSTALALLEKEAKLAQIHTLVANITSENQASLRLFEKNGYQKCAHFKEVGKKFGRILDLVCLEKIL